MGKREKKWGKIMKALKRTNFHLTTTITFCNESMNSMTCENYNLVKILI